VRIEFWQNPESDQSHVPNPDESGRQHRACSRLVGARFRDDDVPVGDWSDIVTATAQA